MKEEREFQFSHRKLESLLPSRPGSRTEYRDSKLKGLYLRVSSKGVKTFVVRKSLQGRSLKVTLGTFPVVSVEEARKMASEKMLEITKGVDPREPKKKNCTLEEFFNNYFLPRYLKVNRKRWKQDESNFRKHCRSIGKKRLCHIDKMAVELLKAEIRDLGGEAISNKVIGLLRTLFKKANEWGWLDKSPCDGVRKFKEEPRVRYLMPEEFKVLAAELESYDQDFQDYIKLLVFTSQRGGNIRSLKWDQVNLDQLYLYLPETKTGTSYTIPLEENAAEILARRKTEAQSEFVFPARRSQSGHMESPKRRWREFIKKSGLTGLRMHDLRSTNPSYAAIKGVHSKLIQGMLGHKDGRSTEIYVRLGELGPVRDAMREAVQEFTGSSVHRSDPGRAANTKGLEQYKTLRPEELKELSFVRVIREMSEDRFDKYSLAGRLLSQGYTSRQVEILFQDSFCFDELSREMAEEFELERACPQAEREKNAMVGLKGLKEQILVSREMKFRKDHAYRQICKFIFEKNPDSFSVNEGSFVVKDFIDSVYQENECQPTNAAYFKSIFGESVPGHSTIRKNQVIRDYFASRRQAS